MVQRRNEHLDPVGAHDPDAVEQVLLGPQRRAGGARGVEPASWSTSS